MERKRFYALERKLSKNHLLNQMHEEFIDEYYIWGHMREITHCDSDHQGYYIPHHAVIKEGNVTDANITNWCLSQKYNKRVTE